jgi:hypothetical protein
MRVALVITALFTLIAFTQVEGAPPENGGEFPGQGVGVGGTFPGGGATNGTFPGGGNGVSSSTVSASEPLSLLLTAGGLFAAAFLARRRR